MFSLIITIISVALVAALALATLYYGGDTFNQGRADAQAAQILNQGQQVLGAAELYYLKNSKWPDTPQDLVVDGFLESVPVAQGPMSEAHAQVARAWVMPTAGVPVFTLPNVETDICKMVNKKTYGLDGVLKQAYTSLAAQCYGTTDDAYTVVVSKGGERLPDALPSTEIAPAPALPSPTDPAPWDQVPGTTTPTTPVTPPPSGSTANFNLTQVYDTSGQIQYYEDGSYYPFFDASQEAARIGSATLSRAGNVYTLQAVDNGAPYMFGSDLLQVSNAGDSAAPVNFVEGMRFNGKARFGTATLGGTPFCEAGQSLAAGSSCLLEMLRTSACSSEYQVPLGNLVVYSKWYDNPNDPCTSTPPVDELPEPDVIQPGSCPFTFDKSLTSLFNQTGNTYTITAVTGYHPNGSLVYRTQNFGYGWSGMEVLFSEYQAITPYSSLLTYYHNIWETTTRPVNVEIPPNHGIGAYAQPGAVALGVSKAAVYVQELDTWCAFGTKLEQSPDEAYRGRGFYIGIPGSTWTPPAVMDGAWTWDSCPDSAENCQYVN